MNIVIGDMHAPSMSQIRANAYVGQTPQPPWRLRTKLEEGQVCKTMVLSLDGIGRRCRLDELQ